MSLTPVFLLTGLATLLNVFSTRLARVTAKADQMIKDLAAADAATAPALRNQLVSLRRRHGFTTPLSARGFTPHVQRQLDLLNRFLVRGPVVMHGRFALLSVWPFASGRSILPEALRYYGRC